jgi:membrane protein EpsK
LENLNRNLDLEAAENEVEAVVEASEGFVAPAVAPCEPESKETPKRGRFLPNLISNAALFGFNILVGLWYTPYLVHHLGTAAYGIIPLVTQITGYMIVLTSTLNSATGRFITIALEQNNDEEANRYFNTTFFGSVLLVLLLIPLVSWATWNLGSLIVIPEGLASQCQWLFVCTVTGFFLGTLQSPFGVSCYCRNRFDLSNTILFIQAVMRVGLVVVFFGVAAPKIWQVGLASLVAMFFGWGWSIQLWRRLTPTLSISFSHFEWNAFRHLFSMGGWIAVSTVGTILFLSIDLLVVNRMFGVEVGGRYAAILQWPFLLRSIATTIGSVFGPTILYYYAQKDMKGLVLYSRQAVKFVGILIALPTGLISGFAGPLLRIWLGPKFVELAPLMFLMTFPLAVGLAYLPLHNISNALIKVRVPGIVQLLAGVLNLMLAVGLASVPALGYYGVAAAGVIVFSLRNILFTPLYASHILKISRLAFLREGILVFLLSVLVMFACWELQAFVVIEGYLGLFLVFFLVSISYLGLAFLFCLNREERRRVLEILLGFKSFLNH